MSRAAGTAKSRGSRAAKTASLGAVRHTLYGTLGPHPLVGGANLEVYLAPAGTALASDAATREALDSLGRDLGGDGDFVAPYWLFESPCDGEPLGMFRVTLPERYRAHWRGTAEELAGHRVKAEVTVRPYRVTDTTGRPRHAGAALDLAMLEAAPPELPVAVPVVAAATALAGDSPT